jgi:hypothetical protein
MLYRKKYWRLILLVSISLFCCYTTNILLAEGFVAKYTQVYDITV